MPKTIQLRDDTYARLRLYKVGGLTFDEVIQGLMSKTVLADFHEEYRAWQERVLANIEKSGKFTEL